MALPNKDFCYPSFARRVRAALIDAVIFAAVFFGLGTALASFEFAGGLKATLFASVVLALEPGLVFTTGGTIGHHTLGLRVQDDRTGNNLSPLIAVVRFLLKSLLGWLSFVLVLVTNRQQAIHDVLSSSVVAIRNPTGIERLEEREREVQITQFEHPSGLRKSIVIFLYIGVLLLLIGILFELTLSERCMKQDRCTPRESLFEVAVSLGWVGSTVSILIFGWNGKLLGARRKKRNE